MMLSPSGNHTSAQLSSSMSHLNPRLGEVSSSMLQINLNSSHELSSSGQRTNRANERRKEVKAAVSLGNYLAHNYFLDILFVNRYMVKDSSWVASWCAGFLFSYGCL